MNRRSFFTLAAPAAAGLLWDPELLLWRPPKVFLFQHVPSGPDLWGYAEVLLREALKVIRKDLVFSRNINRHYDIAYASPPVVLVDTVDAKGLEDSLKGTQPGQFIKVRTPDRYAKGGPFPVRLT